jgi:hypothetical protein
MNLKEIVSISGKGGLHKVVSRSNKNIIVQDINNPATKNMINTNYHVAMLEEITVYSVERDDLYLKDILKRMMDSDKEIPNPKASSRDLREYFNELVPEHDADRGYTSDIKKIIKWYNSLEEFGMLQTEEEEKPGAEIQEEETSEEQVEAKELTH